MIDYDFRNKCGKGRGCSVVRLPIDDKPVDVFGATQFSVFCVHPVYSGRPPYWKVVRWDVDEVTDLHRQAVG
jgi:hypothetical protein